MKKLLLILSAVGITALSANAQTRLSIYEEFSGENCNPCAASNPGLWTLLSANTATTILVKYQSPIPTAGPIYNANKVFTNNRISYYSVPFAPYGRLNGTGLGTGTAASGSPGHVANLTQADLDAAAAVAAPFNIDVTGAWNSTGDSITATVTVKCVSSYSVSGNKLKLRLGIIEHLVYATPPGTNGETDFHNVIREMYPNADGTSIDSAWASGDSMTYVISGKVPYYVDKTNHPRLAVWVQNDNDKSIPQAAVSSNLPDVSTDLSIQGLPSTVSKLTCAGATFAPTVTLKNTGTTTITSATILYRIGSGAWSSQPWTGSLAAGASLDVVLTGISLTAVGSVTFSDSVYYASDMNSGNNKASTAMLTVNTAPKALPINNTWESNTPSGWYFYDSDGSGKVWSRVWSGSSSQNIGHNASVFTAWYDLTDAPVGNSSMMILPTPAIAGATAMGFYVAYAQYDASNNDKLEVLYSADCGATWTSMWNKSGSALATIDPQASFWAPSDNSEWKEYVVDLTNLPANSILAFKETAAGGNNIFIDDIKIQAGYTGIKNIVSQSNVSLAPNPARDFSKLTFTLNTASNVTVEVFDVMGRLVTTVANQNMNAGEQTLDIHTASMTSGLYNVKITTNGNSVVERLFVGK